MTAMWICLAGPIHDRKGPRLIAGIGCVLFSVGYLLGSYTDSLPWFYLSMGVCVGMGNGFGYVVPLGVASKWFPDKRGLVMGLMIGGYGAGSGIFGPIASRLIESVGWRETFQIYALLFFAMTAIGTWLLKNPPPGFQPEGWHPSQLRPASRPGPDVPTSRMVRDPTFWALWIAYCLGTTGGTMVISQLVPFARSAGHAAAVAALAITVGAIGNASGRIFSGWISDHIGRLNALKIALIISTAAMPALYLLRADVALFYALLTIVYYCYGTQLSLYPITSADFYGTKYLGANYGVLILAWGVAGIFGPSLGGRVYMATGEYRWAFFAAAAVELAALGILFVAKNPRHEAPAEPMMLTEKLRVS